MDSSSPSLLRRVVAVVVLLLVAIVALRLAIGFVTGLVMAALWIIVIAALVIGALWARSTLKSAKRPRRVKSESPGAIPAAPAEDPVAAEMRRITEQLREQGRR